MLPMVVMALALVSTTASADDGFEEKNDASGQHMIFKDDPLAALPNDGAGATILVRPSGARMMLLRPRTHFLVEMLKSVESL